MRSNALISGKWNEIYDTEQDLINDMMKTVSDIKLFESGKIPFRDIVQGYVYIDSFKKYYEKNGRLTDKQMTQLKRLAGSVYQNTHK